jgi:hypothetical protein
MEDGAGMGDGARMGNGAGMGSQRDFDSKGENHENIGIEKIREANVRRNHAVMQSLGIELEPVQPVIHKRARRSRAASKKNQAGEDEFKAEDRTDAGRVGGISDRESDQCYECGQLVWSQFNRRDGQKLWPAKILERIGGGDMYMIQWENPDGADPCFRSHSSKLRKRPICGCGNCIASVLINDQALEGHNMRVSNCQIISACASRGAFSTSWNG